MICHLAEVYLKVDILVLENNKNIFKVFIFLDLVV